MAVRPLAAIGMGVGAALLAALLAITINTGILRAAGSVQGPGRLGAVAASPAAAGESSPRSTEPDHSPARGRSPVPRTSPYSGGARAPSAPGGLQRVPEHEFGAGNDD